jgi:hypothetical protein
MAKYRILSLDGGGSWALIEVMALIEMYTATTTGHQVLNDFDLAVANSGGSIVLGGLVEDMQLGMLRNFFLSLEKRESIFKARLFHLPGFEKYDTEQKLLGLQAALPLRGKMILKDAAADIASCSGNAPLHLLIMGFDYDRTRGRFFRSVDATSPAYGDGDAASVQLAEALHASTNAPVRYFDKPAELPTEPGKRYWDGAISGCNNPVLAGVAEAIVLGHHPEDIIALSLGTGGTALPQAPEGDDDQIYFSHPQDPSLLKDLDKLAAAIVDDPPDAASFLAHVFTGGKPTVPLTTAKVDSRIVRLNPLIAPVKPANGDWQLPTGLDVDEFGALLKLDMDAVAQVDVDKIQHFAELWLQNSVSNQPIRMDADLNIEVGHATYAEAIAAWDVLKTL